MTIDEVIEEIVESGIELGAGDYVDVEVLKEAVKYLERYKQMQWISVKDRLPGKQTVLVYAESDDEDSPVWCTGYYKPNGRWKGWFLSGKIDSDIFKHVEESDDFKVTHWMPLPEPPEVNEE